jgi:hypothetical protein
MDRGGRDSQDLPSHKFPKGDSDLFLEDNQIRDRLKRSRDLQKLLDDAQALARKAETDTLLLHMLQDEKFQKRLLKRFSQEELERLKKRILEDRKALGKDDLARWQKVIEDSEDAGDLSSRQKDLLRRWAEKNLDLGGDDNTTGPVPPRDKSREPSTSSSDPDSSGSSSFTDSLRNRSSTWLKNNLESWVRTLDEHFDSPFGSSWRDAIKELARTAAERNLDKNMPERLRRLSQDMPRLRDLFPKSFTLAMNQTRTPSLPNIDSVRAPRLPSTPSSTRGLSFVLLWGLVVVIVVLVLFKGGAWYRHYRATVKPKGWRLGAWPVAPGAVSTRADLVRAFEYLAMLCLGRAAVTCHHLELAARLGSQPAREPDRRQHAAHHLAHLYEQARYTPDDEALPPHEMETARRELCYLAGVSAP